MLPARVATLLHEPLHLLRTRACGDEQGVGHVDNDQIVDSKEGNQPAGPGHNDTPGSLLCDNCVSMYRR